MQILQSNQKWGSLLTPMGSASECKSSNCQLLWRLIYALLARFWSNANGWFPCPLPYTLVSLANALDEDGCWCHSLYQVIIDIQPNTITKVEIQWNYHQKLKWQSEQCNCKKVVDTWLLISMRQWCSERGIVKSFGTAIATSILDSDRCIAVLCFPLIDSTHVPGTVSWSSIVL